MTDKEMFEAIQKAILEDDIETLTELLKVGAKEIAEAEYQQMLSEWESEGGNGNL